MEFDVNMDMGMDTIEMDDLGFSDDILQATNFLPMEIPPPPKQQVHPYQLQHPQYLHHLQHFHVEEVPQRLQQTVVQQEPQMRQLSHVHRTEVQHASVYHHVHVHHEAQIHKQPQLHNRPQKLQVHEQSHQHHQPHQLPQQHQQRRPHQTRCPRQPYCHVHPQLFLPPPQFRNPQQNRRHAIANNRQEPDPPRPPWWRRVLKTFLGWFELLFVATSYSLSPVMIGTILFVNTYFQRDPIYIFLPVGIFSVIVISYCTNLMQDSCYDYLITLNMPVQLPLMLRWVLRGSGVRCLPKFSAYFLHIVSATASLGYCLCLSQLVHVLFAIDLHDLHVSSFHVTILFIYLGHQFVAIVTGRYLIKAMVSLATTIYVSKLMFEKAAMTSDISFIDRFPSILATTVMTMGAVSVAYPLEKLKGLHLMNRYSRISKLVMILVVIWQLSMSFVLLDFKVLLEWSAINRNFFGFAMLLGVIEHLIVPVDHIANLFPNSNIFKEISRAIFCYFVLVFGFHTPTLTKVLIMIGSICAFDQIVFVPILCSAVRMWRSNNMNAWTTIKLGSVLGIAVFFCYSFITFTVYLDFKHILPTATPTLTQNTTINKNYTFARYFVGNREKKIVNLE